jgi:hypothetical protein
MEKRNLDSAIFPNMQLRERDEDIVPRKSRFLRARIVTAIL